MHDTVCPTCHTEGCEDPSHLVVQDPMLTFTTAREMMAEPAPIEIVESFLQVGRITVVVSEPSAGKTFLLLDVAAAITSAVSWHGREVVHGSIAYLSYEGDALGVRLRAIHSHHGHRLEHLYLLRAFDPLSPRISRDGDEQRSLGEHAARLALIALRDQLIAQHLPPIRLLVVDTVRASLTGSEDTSDNAAAYIRVVRRLLRELPDAAAALAHHAGWQDGDSSRKRERGSSAWRGNCDNTVYLDVEHGESARGQTHLTLRILKMRDGEWLPPLALVRQQVSLNESTRRGQPVTSCVITSDHRTREDREAEMNARMADLQQTNDLLLLRAVAEHQDQATSQDKIRMLVGMRRDPTYESLSRLVRKGWLRQPDKKGQTYTVTDTGVGALSPAIQAFHENRPESSQNRPT